MTIRSGPGRRQGGYPRNGNRNQPNRGHLTARLVVLSRAYPLLKQAAEILELEAIEPQATTAKRLRQDVGAMLADLVPESDATPGVD